MKRELGMGYPEGEACKRKRHFGFGLTFFTSSGLSMERPFGYARLALMELAYIYSLNLKTKLSRSLFQVNKDFPTTMPKSNDIIYDIFYVLNIPSIRFSLVSSCLLL